MFVHNGVDLIYVQQLLSFAKRDAGQMIRFENYEYDLGDFSFH
jgi:hypothetical protein